MKGIELEIFFNNDQTSELNKLDIDFNYKDCDVKKITFYQIENIKPSLDDDGTEYCSIGSNGEDFICVLNYEQVRQKLENF